MPETSPPGPIVSGGEDVYRAILYPWQWAVAQSRPSSAAFDDEVFSVDIASRTTPSQMAARFHFVLRLVQFNCGDARLIGFDAREEMDPLHPNNNAHAHVYFLDYRILGDKLRKRKARRLADICQLVKF